MDKIEEKILNTIDAHREEIVKVGRDIWNTQNAVIRKSELPGCSRII